MTEYSGFSKTGNVVCMIMALDFFSFLISYVVLGGGALNGRIVAGRYFLSDHGKLIETSEALFQYSKIHGLSLFMLLPFAMYFGFSAALRRRKHENA